MNTFEWKDKKFIVGERFKELRESLDKINGKCTQEELAKELGICKAQISNIESGKRTPSLNELIKYSDKFKVPIEYLLGKIDTKSYKNVNIGYYLGLNDKAIEWLKKGKQNDFSLVTVLNNICEINYATEFFTDLLEYFIKDNTSFTRKPKLFVGEIDDKEKTIIGEMISVNTLKELTKLKLYQTLATMKNIFDKKGFECKDISSLTEKNFENFFRLIVDDNE